MNEFFYKISWRTRGHTPGSHPARAAGPGYAFMGHRALSDGADPRRLDIRASLKDPFGRWQVKVFTQESAIPVTVIADVSASMHFKGETDRWQSLKDFIEAAARSVTHQGDSFSLIAADNLVRDDLYIPPTHRRSVILELENRFKTFNAAPRAQAEALLAAAERLQPKKNLIFLVSDFHWTLDFTETLMERLSGHDVIPIVLWDPLEVRVPEGQGLVRLKDSETGLERLLWLRSSVRSQWLDKIHTRKAELHRLLASYGRPPLVFEGPFNPDRLTRYFLHH